MSHEYVEVNNNPDDEKLVDIVKFNLCVEHEPETITLKAKSESIHGFAKQYRSNLISLYGKDDWHSLSTEMTYQLTSGKLPVADDEDECDFQKNIIVMATIAGAWFAPNINERRRLRKDVFRYVEQYRGATIWTFLYSDALNWIVTNPDVKAFLVTQDRGRCDG